MSNKALQCLPVRAPNVQVQIQGGFSGSVQGTDPVPESFDLTLADAIQRGLRTNLGIISADISVQGAQARRLEARSALLPSVSVNASENAAKLNLAAEGFSASAFGDPSLNFPTSVGPYHYYDLHGSLQQSLLDVTAVRNLRAQGRAFEAAVLQAHQGREEVVLAATGVYLQLVWHAPYRVDVTNALKPGTNELTVKVVNAWVNRLIGDQQPDTKVKYTFATIKPYSASSALQASGLLGPVTVIRQSGKSTSHSGKDTAGTE